MAERARQAAPQFGMDEMAQTKLRAILVALAAAGGMTLVGSAPAAAAGDPILSRLVGEWIGGGMAKSAPNANPEHVFCKITNSLSADGKSLQQRGRCALPAQSTSIKGTITASGGGKYAGSMQSLQTDGAATLTGTGSGDTIDFVAEYVDRLSKKPGTSKVSLIVTGEGYRLVTNVTGRDKKPFLASDISFRHP